MTEYTTIEHKGTRLRWVYDEYHETIGSYAYDTEEETKAAEQWELERLNDGRLVALGCIVEEKTECSCPECTGYHETDSLWGIVIDPNDAELESFAKGQGWI